MKTKTTRQENQEKKYAKVAVGIGPEYQGEETNSATPEEVAEFYNNDNPPVKLRDVFSLTFS